MKVTTRLNPIVASTSVQNLPIVSAYIIVSTLTVGKEFPKINRFLIHNYIFAK